jgi:uncharacterized membrane protein YdjX (TVP38/TMEM64 family)
MSGSTLKKIILVSFIAAIVAAFFFFDLGQYLTLSYLRESRDKFALLYSENRIMVIGIYAAIYIVATALSLPGATILTLAGGALFGLWTGVLVISFASTIGATLACFVSRFILRNWVQNRFADKLRVINNGVEKDGPFYLFTLRLIPVFPFFVINLLMGLTKMPLRTYYWISQAGMLPATFVYVNAGKELGKLESLSGILSPTLIISFAILGVFPLAVKKGLNFYLENIKIRKNAENRDEGQQEIPGK